MRERVLLSWSSGKDSAWALHRLRAQGVEVAALLTTVHERTERVAMHDVRGELLRAQAQAAGLPLDVVPLPSPCPNDVYGARMQTAMQRALDAGITAVAFGDLFLEDIRAYRERMLAGCGMRALFPLWGEDTAALAREMIDGGCRAVLTCVDPAQCPPRFVGRAFDHALLAELPPSVDPCGENGEFHTFVHAGPMFEREVPVVVGEACEREGFWYVEVRCQALSFEPRLRRGSKESAWHRTSHPVRRRHPE